MDTETIKQQAYQSATQAANLQTSAPGLLSQLKQNLIGIFSKGNPIMQARDAALSDYLSTPARARADLLPTNLPQIEGRNLALSPTQQEAITTSRSSAALAPLAGLNEIIKAMYGNIGESVKGAGDIYSAQIGGANTSASNLLDFYKTAVAEEEARKKSGGLGDDLLSIIAALTGGGKETTPTLSLDEIFGGAKQVTQKSSKQSSKYTLSPNLFQGKELVPGVPSAGYAPGSVNLGKMNIVDELSKLFGKPGTGLGLAGGYQNPLTGLNLRGLNL